MFIVKAMSYFVFVAFWNQQKKAKELTQVMSAREQFLGAPITFVPFVKNDKVTWGFAKY
jgi:hypothetical protein